MSPLINIAIDGPSGAGKSTLARKLAEKLGFIYVDTGALYRAVALYAVRERVPLRDRPKIIAMLQNLDIGLAYRDGVQRVLLNGEDVSGEIRSPEVSMAASDVSPIPEVRAFLLGLQKDLAKKNNVIMDGRDIGTVVLPEAKLKIFLHASPEDRARRRYEELRQKGQNVAYEDVLSDLKTRDAQDAGRAVAPLKPAADAVIVNTTGFEIEKSFATLYNICREKLGLPDAKMEIH